MPVDRSNDPLDTRGLPASIDPHNFYEYKSAKIANSDLNGIEFLIWKLIPYNYIKSFAIAIDPLWKFRISPARIQGVNRTVTRSRSSVLDRIVTNYEDSTSIYSTTTTAMGCNRADYAFRSSGGSTWQSVNYSPTVGLKAVSKDTTYRTRPAGFDYGECELFKFNVFSPGRSYNRYTNSKINWSSPPNTACEEKGPRKYDVFARSSGSMGPSGSYLTQSVVDAIRNECKMDSQFQLASRGMELVRRAMPTSRSMTYARSIAELKDIPRSIESLQRTCKDLSDVAKNLGRIDIFDLSRASKSIPNEYLSYHFGWKQLYNDIMSTLSTPQVVERRINRLMRRNGLDTTFRSQMHVADAYKRSSGFVYPTTTYDGSSSLEHRVEREFILQCAISANFRFPPVDRVKFRRDTFTRMLGIVPNPVDIYKLVPWTWLYDWFTGFGNYLDLIETINKDRSLINFGFLSCKCKGNLISSFRSELTSSYSYDIDHVSTVVKEKTPLFHTSMFNFSYYVREDVTRLTDIKSFTDPSSLTTFQSTILGALIYQRARF